MKELSRRPKVSVVIPVYNAGKYIRQAVESILNQSYDNLEILIADDQSKDDSKNILESFTDVRIRLHPNPENLGYLKTCNKLFSLASGELITWQDADDFSAVNRIEIQVNEFLKDPALGMCGSYHVEVNEEGEEIKKVARSVNYEEIKESMWSQYQFCGATMMIRKEIMDEMGGYRIFFNRIRGEDYDLAYRIIEKYKSVNIPQYLYYYRHYPYYGPKPGYEHNVRFFRYDDIVRFLAKQRRDSGTDSLESGDTKELDRFLLTMDEEYTNDPSLVHRQFSYIAINKQNYPLAIRFAVKAIRDKPFLFKNYSSLVYCLYVISRRILKI